MKFRKKPVVVEAWRCSQLLRWSDSAWKKLPPQVVAQYDAGNVVFADTFMLINTLEGRHRAEFGDMVICGVKGELYPCKPDIFAATYEPVEPSASGGDDAMIVAVRKDYLRDAEDRGYRRGVERGRRIQREHYRQKKASGSGRDGGTT